ncbi:hypothetical protein ROHU_017770 [Labeo rohita]|uniref:Uncharacterized protein n=1 Tax=Labeo rohita TaxID=84645 RepID=A0A498NBE9_LABRO|nr:hypothetical protein ROHU_017770 [Labeo rohita]
MCICTARLLNGGERDQAQVIIRMCSLNFSVALPDLSRYVLERVRGCIYWAIYMLHTLCCYWGTIADNCIGLKTFGRQRQRRVKALKKEKRDSARERERA